jgi:hypothetical protein
MKSEPRPTRVWKGEGTNLLLFPDELSTPAEPSPWPNPPPVAEISLAQITAKWQALLKRLGRRRRVLETILTAGRPIRLIDDTLVVGFPPYRRFHRELLDIPDYRNRVEEELARMFHVRLSVVTALYPESRGLHRKGAFSKTPA